METDSKAPCEAVRTGKSSWDDFPDRHDALCLLSVFDRLQVRKSDFFVDDLITMKPGDQPETPEQGAARQRVQSYLWAVGHEYAHKEIQTGYQLEGKGLWKPKYQTVRYHTLSREDLERLSKLE